MSITSPRPSSALQSPTSSRSSLSLDRHNLGPGGTRRNRSALRDYYNLKVATPTDETAHDTSEDHSPISELDKSDFNAPAYVSNVLKKESLENLLKVEAGLVSEIRGLDGERKALVYDNYSKLIAATDTIRRMRTNMDPLAPMTTTLEPAMAHIVQTASELSDSLRSKTNATDGEARTARPADNEKAQTVRWVLESPRRLEMLLKEDKRDQAVAEWAEVEKVLVRWDGVGGVEEIRQKAQAAMAN